MHRIFGTNGAASALRTILRAAIVIATAFGWKLSADQVAAIQLGIEALLQAGQQWYGKGF
jgi:hypothetical protein